MTVESLTVPKRKTRTYLSNNFVVVDWEHLQPWFEALINRKPKNREEALRWMRDRSELEAVVQEEARWRFIRTTLDTANEDYQQSFGTFVKEIEPNLSAWRDKLNHKFLEEPVFDSFKDGPYFPLVRKIRQRVKLYSEANTPLLTEEKMLQKQYEEIMGSMSVPIDGKECTLQQAAIHLKSIKREKREEIWLKLSNRKLLDKLELDQLLSKMIKLRHQIALNANFENYRDFRFAELGRFDYTPEDCVEFHEAIRTEIVPLLAKLDKQKKVELGVESLRPWDSTANASGLEALKPFENTTQMVERAMQAFNQVDPFFANCLGVMSEMKHLDLDSRIGKAPGGYNCGLPEIGIPFIFMNATGSTRDVKTIMHEGGHAVHSFLAHELELTGFKEITSEIAELASMAMELITQKEWGSFYPNPEDLKRARKEHLRGVLSGFPWMASIDSFQHWLYLHPDHSIADREKAWIEIWSANSTGETNWSDLEHYRVSQWQSQLHIYKVPFYYIEYAIAQLGAIAIWRNYMKDPEKTLNQYRNALSLGYTKPIGEIYQEAGIEFRFDRAYVRELAEFVLQQIEEI